MSSLRTVRSRCYTAFKVCSGFVAAMLVFGVPLVDALPLLDVTPMAQAQSGGIIGTGSGAGVPTGGPDPSAYKASVSAGLAEAPAFCAPLAVICTDWGQYQFTIGRLQAQVEHQLLTAAFTSAWNAATYFSQTVAYDAAEWVANGFEGQAPGIFTDQWDVYLRRVSLDAAGEFMGSFSEDFTKGALGLDLCAPPDFPQLALDFSLSIPGLLNAIERPAPKCSWSTITKNWEQASQSLDNVGSLQNIRAQFTSGGNDISFGVGAHIAFFDYVAAQREAGLQKRLEGQGYKSVSNFISGEIETPASAVKKATEFQLIEAPYVDQSTRFNALLNNSFNIGFVQLGALTASTFTNVLLSRLLGKITSGLFKSSGTAALPNLFDPNAAPGNSTNPEQIFASQYSDIKAPHIVKTSDQDLLSELVACPDDGRTRWNCALDEHLGTAIRQGGGLTVRQAVDQGFISPEWELIPSSQLRDNQDPNCHERAFCSANLSKLRLARVLPIGWEIAAESPVNQLQCESSEGCITLREVMDRFNDCSNDGQLDDAHPFCHLIDPNWVLTILPAQCQVEGFGNQIIRGTNQRLSECQETTTCLRRDKNGTCIGGFGFCMAEQTFWQFDAPMCEPQFASCRTFTPRGDGRQVSYLRSTLDYGSCSADNVGCMWYALYRNRDTATVQGPDAWAATTTAGTIPDGSAMDRVYLDATVEPCDASGDGCTALLRVQQGVSALNLVQNGSFETVAGAAGFLDGWEVPGSADAVYTAPDPGTGVGSVHGAQALYAAPSVGSRVSSARPTAVRPLRQYALSFFARTYAGDTAGATVRVEQRDAAGDIVEPTGTTYFQSEGCAEFPGTARGAAIEDVGSEWTRFSCVFVTTERTQQATLVVTPGSSDNASPLVDAIQLEEAEVPTAFVNGVNTALTQVNMKVPPEELACMGESSTDHPLCTNFAQVCRQNEAGCQGYRATDGGTEIPAVLTDADRCPAECVGYAEYRKQASTFDLVRNPDARLDDAEDVTAAFLIPQTGLSCSAQDVGCEVFTNLDADAGGASAQAYRALRSCELPGGDTQTYYTWEGSDTSGYQLRTWSLKHDTSVPVPQGPKVIIRTGPGGILKDPAACTASTYLSATDPDCRQFYDPEGNVFYRFESQTVLSSDACIQLRKEGSTRADCEKTGGVFNAASAQCVYRADPGSSAQCDATYAGCRAYVGTQGRAQEEIFFEEFTGDTFQVSATLTDAVSSPTTLARSEESVLVGDTSLRVQTSGNFAGMFAGPMTLTSTGLYEISFWAKASDPSGTTVTVHHLDGSLLSSTASVSLGPNWRTYRIGPLSLPEQVVRAGRIPLRVTGSSIVFFDKLRVERVQDVSYVVKDSWSTPASCDRTPEGIPSPQAMLGCRAYTTRDGQEVTARQFTRLCRETAIGCTAFVNTQNTPTPARQTWERAPAGGAATPERTVSFEDRYDYYIDDPSHYCREDALGCRAFGRPNYGQDRQTLKSDAPFTTVYLKTNPAAYDTALCSEPELFCEAYAYANDKESGTTYFRAPADHACEYRRAATVNQSTVSAGIITDGRTFDGWFRVGTDIPCAPDLLQAGSVFGIRYTGDSGYNAWAGTDASNYSSGTWPAGYQGWAGTCPQAAAECTEIRDVNDTSDPAHPSGRPYYVVNNLQLDTRSCNGRVNPGDGCVLFRDAVNPNLTSSAKATYDLYQSRLYQAVDPVDCVATPGHERCVAVSGRCTNVRAVCNDPECVLTEGDRSSVINLLQGKVCQQDAECGVDFVEGSSDVVGVCAKNDSNTVIRVKPDRACSAWLACSTAETVLDPQDGTYKSICSDLTLCSQVGAPDGNSVPFCANTIDRTTSEETILQQYTVLSAERYASRPTGFGAQDYSGAATPDQFQVMDTSLVPLGAMLSTDATTKSRLAKDYRLAVAVPIISTFDVDTATTSLYVHGAAPAEDLNANLSAGIRASDLAPYACVYKSPGTPTAFTVEDQEEGISFGVMTDSRRALSVDGTLCWLALDQSRPAQLSDTGAPLVSDNLNALALIAKLEQSLDGATGQALERSFPGAQCKAAPEADAPFDNRFVLEWDGSVTPPVPRRVREGYRSTNFCEYGEDCSCTYKRINYGGPTKFYEPLSTDVVNALCVGGPRAGLPCTVDAGISGSVPTNVQTVGEGDAAQQVDVNAVLRGENTGIASANEICGEGGICRPIQFASLVRGVTGQCLQYDTSRPLQGSQSEFECLQWSPGPLFSGPSDPYHWSPTAGFQPPQSSGRYYCLSPYRQPRTIALRPGVNTDLTSEGGGTVLDENRTSPPIGFKLNSSKTYYAGQIKHFWYHSAMASDGSCLGQAALSTAFFVVLAPTGPLASAGGALAGNLLGCDGNSGGASLDGARADGTDMGLWCEEADDDQSPAGEFGFVRLITTGKGRGRGYAEYAVLVDPNQIGRMIAGYQPGAIADPTLEYENSLEDAISSFSFETPQKKIGCAYSEDWVEGISVSDYDDEDVWRSQDSAWQAGFRQTLAQDGGVLSRRNAQVVTEDNSPEGTPVKVDCVNETNEPEDESGCYLKTWELNYRAQGQPKFQAFNPDTGRLGLDHLSRAPFYATCDASQSWFSIRAVFENTNGEENAKEPEELVPAAMTGPFQFVGFWVTACSPQSGPRYIYMSVSINTADVCRELAETISKDSHESAAFTDRNWAFGSFTVPKLGYQWESSNVPFGASLATRTADEEPLYMSGVRQSQSNVLHPPTFTKSGQTYFRGAEYPKNNWGTLSNIFARIYRIYAYSARGVDRDDWACTNLQSPNFGQWCPDKNVVGDEKGDELSQEYCGYEAKCVGVGFSGRDLFAERVCNSFSGVNRGLDCTTDPDICHAGPAQLGTDLVWRTQFTSCDQQPQWTDEPGGHIRCTGNDCPAASTGCLAEGGCGRQAAITAGAFRCAPDSARAGSGPDEVPGNLSYCSTPTPDSVSEECPKLVKNDVCVVPSGETVGHCRDHNWAECIGNADCRFELQNYWPPGLAVNDRFNARPTGNDASRQFSQRMDPPYNLTDADPEMGYYITGDGGSFPPLDTQCDEDDPQACLIKPAFAPVTPWASGIEASDVSWFYPRRLQDDTNGDVVAVRQIALYPGFVPLIRDEDGGIQYSWRDEVRAESIAEAPYIRYAFGQEAEFGGQLRGAASYNPRGICVSFETENSTGRRCVGGLRNNDVCNGNEDCDSDEAFAHYAACEPKTLMVGGAVSRERKTVSSVGVCRGGLRNGSMCGSADDCVPEGITQATRDASANWCNPVTSPTYGFAKENAACWPDGERSAADADNRPARESDPALDNNICTHPAGYWPRPNLCIDPNDEYCGLFGYDIRTSGRQSTASVSDDAPLPTDVTPGFYTPAFPGLNGSPDNRSSNLSNYSYADFYTPIPPTIAAPDMRSCEGGSCKIAGLGTFSIDSANGGVVNGTAGSHVASVRFYAWAAHDQMPLRRLVIDWGDGQQTELPDAFLKNHKPYCQTEKECVVDVTSPTHSTGLTCQTDNDCLPGLGAQCLARGSCASGPRSGQACVTDRQCNSSTAQDGICQPRLYFGNDADACEEQFLEFRHAYTCGAESQPTASCASTFSNGQPASGRCSGDQQNACNNDTQCAEGDTCLQTTAPVNGCYNEAIRTCRFTPRILIVDNWGWCAGECRAERNSSGQLIDATNTRVLHPNGGCYDASRLRSNVNPGVIIGSSATANECSAELYPNLGSRRPWVVFPGSVQVRTAAGEE